MANHGFISSRKHFVKEQVILDLQEINERRFKGLLKIEDSNWGKNGSWFISYHINGQDYPVGFNIWIASKRKLEHRHSGMWAYYLEIVFSEELGAKYNGILSDEGHNNKWKPDPNKYDSYRSWLDELYSHIKKSNPNAYKKLTQFELKYAPLELRDC